MKLNKGVSLSLSKTAYRKNPLSTGSG